MLRGFSFSDELRDFPLHQGNSLEFFHINGQFGFYDAEYYYNIIRYFKPRKIVEIGAGNSSLMAINAIKENMKCDGEYHCELVCIEPYERDWLDKIAAKVIRKKLEDVDISVFGELNKNDILFIDSSHVIRPDGDVLLEILEILPILKSGVMVHIHDVFTPLDYFDTWGRAWDVHYFFNEQYLVEAFLSFNTKFEIIAMLNHLQINYLSQLLDACPISIQAPDRHQAASIWLKVI